MYWCPNSRTAVWSALNWERYQAYLVGRIFASMMKRVPGRRAAGPCGKVMKFRAKPSPVWNLPRSIRPFQLGSDLATGKRSQE